MPDHDQLTLRRGHPSAAQWLEKDMNGLARRLTGKSIAPSSAQGKQVRHADTPDRAAVARARALLQAAAPARAGDDVLRRDREHVLPSHGTVASGIAAGFTAEQENLVSPSQAWPRGDGR
jgi:hypothetical protein